MIRLITIAMTSILLGLTSAQPPALAQTPEDESPPPPDFFIEAEIDNPNPYLGQQVTYVLRRYQATEFPNPPHYEDRTLTGFYDTPLLQRPSYTTTVAGREYKVHPIHIALFPTLPGPVTIPPARLIIPGDGLEADTIIESEPLSLEVRPLPPDPPVDFKGAVGQFEISAKFNPSEGEVDQPLTLIVEIEGTGNIATLPEPIIPTIENWRLLGAAKTQTDISLSKEKVKGKRRLEWSLVPAQGGQQYFPAINFSYFDPNTETYQSIRTDPISTVIFPLPTDNVPPTPLPPVPHQEVQRLSSDIRHIKAVPDSLTATLGILTPASPWLWACALLPLLAVGGAWYFQRWRSRYLADTPTARRRWARRRAKKLLAAGPHPETDTYTTIHSTLTGYLSDKLGHPITGLTTSQLAHRLSAAGLPPHLVERVHTLLSRIETGRFAPLIDEESSSRSLLAATRRLIDDLEKFFSK